MLQVPDQPSPQDMTANERLNEIAHLLAIGFLRSRQKNAAARSFFRTENPVDFPLPTERSCFRSQEKGGMQ